MKIKPFSIFALFALLIAGTLFAETSPKVRIVATFTIPADWVKQIAGDRAEVISLVPPNADNHAYQPSPGDLKKIRAADFVVAVSPQFEKWFDEISKNERKKNPAKFVFLGEAFFHGTSTECDCGDAHAHPSPHSGKSDPHFWTNPALVAKFCVPALEKALKIDGSNYQKALAMFETEAEKALAAIPKNRRKIVTYHNNMTHFAERFGFEIAGTILGANSTEASDPSAKTVAKLTKKIRRERLPVFIDNTVSSKLPATITQSAGIPASTVLRVDALDCPGTPSDTYLGMMRENLRALLEACN